MDNNESHLRLRTHTTNQFLIFFVRTSLTHVLSCGAERSFINNSASNVFHTILEDLLELLLYKYVQRLLPTFNSARQRFPNTLLRLFAKIKFSIDMRNCTALVRYLGHPNKMFRFPSPSTRKVGSVGRSDKKKIKK